MPDGVSLSAHETTCLFLSLTDALQQLSSERFPTGLDLSVQVQDRTLSFTADQVASGLASRRLAGLMNVIQAAKSQKKSLTDMQTRKPVLHADVANILDALRNKP
ncbi:MAG: hypothetical protein AAFR74_05360 [Pseudomonadota bacterium]